MKRQATAPRDYQPPTAANRQPPPTANRQPPSVQANSLPFDALVRCNFAVGSALDNNVLCSTSYIFRPMRGPTVAGFGCGRVLYRDIQSFCQGSPEEGGRGEDLRNADRNESSRALCFMVMGWRLVVVGGWRLAVGGWWRLATVSVGWWLAVGSWRRLAMGGPWGLSLTKKNLASSGHP